MRTTVELSEGTLRRLSEICRRQGVPQSEVVRRALADYLEAYCRTERLEVFGMWRDRGIDGLEYERRIRGGS